MTGNKILCIKPFRPSPISSKQKPTETAYEKEEDTLPIQRIPRDSFIGSYVRDQQGLAFFGSIDVIHSQSDP